jgi:hypothetical protein
LRKATHPVENFFDRVFGAALEEGDRLLLLRRTGEQPLDILTGTAYARWQTVLSRTRAQRAAHQN